MFQKNRTGVLKVYNNLRFAGSFVDKHWEEVIDRQTWREQLNPWKVQMTKGLWGFVDGCEDGGGGGGNRGVRVSRFPCTFSRLPCTFSRLPYFCAPLPPDSRPSLCCFHLQVNQEDQKPGFNFQTVPKLNILVHFLVFVLAGGLLGPNESCYRSWPMT